MLADLTITCVECGVEFVFGSEEQSFYQAQGFKRAPRRCRGCRRHRKARDRGEAVAPRQAASTEPRRYEVNCSGCGIPTRVPFRPDPARPAFCRTCYSSRRTVAGRR
ncbi:MAG: zinc-ribbon domain containing protein [Acidobacteriota bacterium]